MAESFISRQQLDGQEPAEIAMVDDSSLPEGTVESTDGSERTYSAQTLTPGPLRTSSSSLQNSLPAPDAAQPRPLCAQEWHIRHVSFFQHLEA